jgi:L-malate glycosyltransferase
MYISKNKEIKLRIAFLAHSTLGGSTKLALNLAKQLAMKNNLVYIIFLRNNPWIELYAGINNLRFIFIDRLSLDNESFFHQDIEIVWHDSILDRAASIMKWLIDNQGIEVFHFHYAIPFARIFDQVKKSIASDKVKFVGTFHGTDVSIYGQKPDFKLCYCKFVNNMDRLTTVSKSHQKLAKEVFNINAPIEIIPNFIDLNEVKENLPDLRKELMMSMNSSTVKIIHISKFRAVKNPLFLGKIFIELTKVASVSLHLVGDGALRNELLNSLPDNVKPNVFFYGFQGNVFSILTKSDFLLLTSFEESFSYVTLEAFACGIPVVAPNVGGIPELVKSDFNGFLYQSGNLHQAVSQCINLIKKIKTNEQKIIKVNCLNTASLYDVNLVIEKYLQLYKQLIT